MTAGSAAVAPAMLQVFGFEVNGMLLFSAILLMTCVIILVRAQWDKDSLVDFQDLILDYEVRQIPGAKMVDVSGAAHMVAGDQNDAFSQAVIDFLETDIRPRLPGKR